MPANRKGDASRGSKRQARAMLLAVFSLALCSCSTPMKTTTLLVWAAGCVAFHAQAQTNYAIDWFTIDGGGGISTGGVYAVSGTIGQPDAGRMSGGNFTLDGGFWSVIAAIQTAGAPFLSVTCTNGVVTVFWPLPATGFVLDHTPTVGGAPIPWTQVPFPYVTNASHILVRGPPAPGSHFYRLRKP